jgi:hypothetical protein
MACAFMLGACSLTESESTEMRIAFGFSEQSAAVLDSASITFSTRVEDGSGNRTLGRPAFASQTPYRYTTGSFETASSGMAHVACILSNPQTSTTGTARIDLRADYAFGVDCLVTDSNPYRECIGCLGYEAVALAPELGLPASDSLFIVWGGNFSDTPVDY